MSRSYSPMLPPADQAQFIQFHCTPGTDVDYNFFAIPPSPEPLIPSQDFLPDFHTSTLYASPPFPDSLYLPPPPTSEATAEHASSSTLKSPTRPRSGNRVPRPRNAFMIFRSEFWAGEKISRTVEHDHRHISRIIGHCWNQLPEAEKDKWREKAEQEKLDHIMKYPGYRFSPSVRTKKVVKRKVKRNSEEELMRCKQVAELLLAGKHGVELDSAVRSMKPPLDDTVSKQENDRVRRSSRSRASSPKDGGVRSPTVESSGNPHPVDYLDIPVFRSPLLPPAETHRIPPQHQPPSSLHRITALDHCESTGMIMSEQFELPLPPFYLPSLGNLPQDEEFQQVPAYFPRFPSLDGHSLSPGGTPQHSEGPYHHYHYEPASDIFNGLLPASATQTPPFLEADPSAYSAMVSPRTPLGPLSMWSFSGLT